MEKLCARWHATGQWSRLNVLKPLFVGKFSIRYSSLIHSFLCSSSFYNDTINALLVDGPDHIIEPSVPFSMPLSFVCN